MARIKAKKSFARSKVPDLLSRGHAVLGGIFNKDNANFTVPPPPIDANTFKNALDDLSAKHADALDGGKKAKEALKKAQDIFFHMLDLLARHRAVRPRAAGAALVRDRDAGSIRHGRADRCLWVWLSRLWSRWRSALNHRQA